MKKILHTEASPGWGGQEIRILKEAEGMRSRGHEVVMAIQKGGGLVAAAKHAGFTVYELPFYRAGIGTASVQLFKIIHQHEIEIINTHSSFDAWLGGAIGKLAGCKVIRTRHLSTPIRKGLNSIALYNLLTNGVVTTCQSIVPMIQAQAKLANKPCQSIPTGIDPQQLITTPEMNKQFRQKWGIKEEDVLIGTLCILRSWKGVSDFLKAAAILRDVDNIKWIVVGGGVSEHYFLEECRQLELTDKVIFTGYMENPQEALAAMDIFLLLSWANEGVSQASLQAAYLKKPLITTTVGGLPEVCIHELTGINVQPRAPQEVADAVKLLLSKAELRHKMGEAAHQLVSDRFTFNKMLDQMENFYQKL